ncbi:MAG: flippase [Calditrichaeota bacterium]|nr:MAG: flippase [Calditrichota bacterium]
MTQLRKNIGYSGISQFLYTVLAFILVPFAARYLDKQEYGIYSLAAAIGFFISLLSDFGLTTLMTRQVSRNKMIAPAFFAETIGLRFYLIIFSLLVFVPYLLLSHLNAVSLQAVIIFVMASLLGSFSQSTFGIFRGFEKMQFESVSVFIEKALSVALGIIILLIGGDVRAFLISFLIAGLLRLFYSLWVVHKRFFPIKVSFHFKRSRVLWLNATPFGISVFLAVCYNYVDILMLSAMKSFEDVAIYSAGHRLLTLTSVVPALLVNAFFPKLAVYHQDPPKLSHYFFKGCKLLFLFSLPMIPFILLFADPIVAIVFGSTFSGSVWVVQVLAFAAFAQMLNTFFVPLFVSVNRQKKIVFFQLGGLLMNIVLNAALIPHYTYKGATIATVATEATILLLILHHVHAHIFSLDQILGRAARSLGKICAAVLAMLMVALAFKQVVDSFWLNALVSVIAYGLALQISGSLDFIRLFKWMLKWD